MTISLNDFLNLRTQMPVVDVRAPKEYKAGHIRGAANVPVLDDEERASVGTAYQQNGKKDAIMMGFRLMGPRLYDIIKATEEVALGNEILVHCWRGGMRSGHFCKFVEMAGMKAHALEGGYKAYRNDGLDYFKKQWKLLRVGGCTGSGKSEIIRGLKAQGEQIIDLEAMAKHKGSAFGGLMMPPQPPTEQFQNDLFELLRGMDPARRIWVEDESISIGQIFLPTDFWRRMVAAPVVQINMEKDIRIDRLVKEYGMADTHTFLEAMEKITKRLGMQEYKTAREHWLAGKKDACIEVLLAYYDKAYIRGLEKKADKIIGHISWDGQNLSKIVHTISQLP